MEINGPKINGVSLTPTKNERAEGSKKGEGKGSTSRSADKVSIKDALSLDVIHKKYADAGDVRSERVAELQQQVESGEYKVDSKQVANKMIDDVLSLLG